MGTGIWTVLDAHGTEVAGCSVSQYQLDRDLCRSEDGTISNACKAQADANLKRCLANVRWIDKENIAVFAFCCFAGIFVAYLIALGVRTLGWIVQGFTHA